MKTILALVASVVLAVAGLTSAVAKPGALPQAPAPALQPSAPPLAPVDNTIPVADIYGQHLDAHDGGLMDGRDGWIYAYGTSYGCGFAWQTPGAPYCGIKIYRTKDLRNYEPAGSFLGQYAFDPSGTYWQSLCDGNGYGCFSPSMVYNPNTNLFDLWINSPDGYRVLESSTAYGPFVNVSRPTMTFDRGGNSEGVKFGDAAVYMDGNTCYLTYTVIGNAPYVSNRHDLAITALDSTCRNPQGPVITMGLDMVEAPATFKGPDGHWYTTYSAPACPYCGTPMGIANGGATPLAAWSNYRYLISDGCQGQGSSVDVVTSPTTGQKVWVQSIDRWDSPGNGIPGAKNQTKANDFWAHLTFTANGGTAIDAYTCQATWTL